LRTRHLVRNRLATGLTAGFAALLLAEPGRLEFSEFGETRTLTAPEAPLDLSQLGA
jgi:hypothetical protein